MTTFTPKQTVGQFAIVDAEGAFDSAGSGKSYVHAAYENPQAALLAAKRMRQVQVIRGNGDFSKGEIVYQDAIGRVYERIT